MADIKFSALGNMSALTGTEQFVGLQGAGAAKLGTAAQMATYVGLNTVLPNPYSQDSGSSAAIYFEYTQNSPSIGRWGVENGTSGGSIFTGSSTDATVFGARTNNTVEFFQNDTKRLTISGTAITSTLPFVATTFNGNTITTGTGTLTLGAGSTLATSATNSITLTSTGATNVTLPTTGTLMTNPMTTGGDVIYGGASGVPTRLANGTVGQVLTSSGTTVAPTWTTIAGTGTVTHTGALTANAIILGNAVDDVKPMASLGTTVTVLHGNAAGAPTFGAVNLATDVTGVLPALINAQTGTTYIVVAGDQGKLVTLSNGSAVAVTQPQATGSFTTGWSTTLLNLGAGLVTITPTTSTINGAATAVLTTGQSVTLVSDGTDYKATFGGQTANGVRSATTTVSVAAATAPSSGQVLTATSSTAATWQTPSAGGSGAPGEPCGRLTLTTGVPVTTADVTGATNIFYTPYTGNNIPLWDGAAWAATTFTQVTLALGTLSSGKPYDVFGFLNTGALNTELLAWTNDTTRATAITLQDGMYCKSGDHTRLYLGTFYTTATTTTEDSVAKRFVWNMYNRELRLNQKSDVTSHTYASSTARSWDDDPAVQSACMLGLAAAVPVKLRIQLESNPAAAGSNSAVYAIWDWTSGYGADGDCAGYLAGSTGVTIGVIAGSSVTNQLAAGYHYLRGVEAEFGANAGTFQKILMTADVMA